MCFEILAHLLRDNSATVHFRWGLTFKGNNFAGRVHDGAVGRDGAADGVVGISHINDDNLSLFTNLLSYTDELVRLHCKRAKSNVGWVDPQILELQVLLEADRQDLSHGCFLELLRSPEILAVQLARQQQHRASYDLLTECVGRSQSVKTIARF